MTGTIKKILLSASVLASLSAIASAPASAASIKNATVTGAAPYLTYDADATNTFQVNNTPGTWVNEQKVLGGNSANPTGNIELFSNSETLSNSTYANYTGVSSLEGTIGGKSITLSSLTAADWNTDVGGTTLAQKWLNDLIIANNLSPLLGANTQTEILDAFVAGGGLQRFSDPNLSYVNQDNDGTIRVGLAGHLNGASLIQQSLQPTQAKIQSGYNTLVQTRTQAQTALNTATISLPKLKTTLNDLNIQLNKATTSTQKTLIQNEIKKVNGLISDANTAIATLPGTIKTLDAQILGVSAKLDPLTAFINNTNLVIQASEIVKVAYNGGPAQYLYSFSATNSGLVEKGDGISHSGNYEVTLKGEVPPSESVPEPSAMLGLLGVGSFFAVKRKMLKKA
ncbi:NF038130 family PEP-CTERM protein [Coleofasciculus sp. FACHB-64]|uniref:NF038130 family PEP-CTERM protein n=1 Tax=Cyanophyceae TaxID=3028117 RepID=UPI0016888EB9|nr:MULTISPECIES: NF038130 family PEP-CTERM protein [unclassified Coleofasciculus]MBD1837773.1 NF038130 family PEP-CTERM protein [Coleofasciculus sp. FACHB-501]MBD2044349.1 NF038130 family PEP-CTERM protein [Coleofasciculus sp. FACHB-64]